MTGQELLDETYIAYRGKVQSRTPAWGSDKAVMLLSIANRKIEEWASDPRNKWNSLFETTAPNEEGTVATAGTTTLTGTGTTFTDYAVGDTLVVSGETVRTIDAITSDTVLTVSVAFDNTDSALTFTRSTIIDTSVSSYNLHRRYFRTSDFARVTKTDGSKVDYGIVKAQKRDAANGQALYVHGLNPQTLTFANDLDSGIDGGTLTVPGYYKPATMTLATDIVPVDDPNWLVHIVAGELARNDPAKEDSFPTLTGMANQLYTNMSNANNDVGFAQVNKVENLMPQISPDLEVDWTL